MQTVGGFELDPDFRDRPEHVAVELEFLYTLEFQLKASLKVNDDRAFKHAGALRWALFNSTWAPGATRFPTRSATMPFAIFIGSRGNSPPVS